MMRKRWISVVALVAYSAILIRVVVFKAVPVIRIGHLRFRFSGQHTGEPNLVPFRTLTSYLHGRSGHLIGTVNLVGNIALFVPVGFLASLVYRRMTRQTALMLAVAVGLATEGMEAVFRVGIFDVDDMILNALGVMIGYGLFAIVEGRMRPRLR
jgi:glycopeptide antibiotics resistance protein